MINAIDADFKPPGIERNENDQVDGVGFMALYGNIKLFTAHRLANKSPKLYEKPSQASEYKNKCKENLYLVTTLSLIDESHLRNPSFY